MLKKRQAKVRQESGMADVCAKNHIPTWCRSSSSRNGRATGVARLPPIRVKSGALFWEKACTFVKKQKK